MFRVEEITRASKNVRRLLIDFSSEALKALIENLEKLISISDLISICRITNQLLALVLVDYPLPLNHEYL
jgi:hypothetical protein